MSIQAIPTRFNGTLYRSRLEARWAVWLTSMNMAFEYEREGYVVDGRPYLCDFWLPSMSGESTSGEWLEIKPGNYYMSEDDVKLYDGMARQTGHRVHLIAGNPQARGQRVSVFQHYHGGKPESVPWGTGYLAVDLKVAWSGANNQMEVACDNGIGIWCERKLEWLPFPSSFSPSGNRERLTDAFEAATNARFEHGETPAMPKTANSAEPLPPLDMAGFAQKLLLKRQQLGIE